MADFTLAKDAEGIATITWDVPEKSMNVMSFEGLETLNDMVDDVLADDGGKGVVIVGILLVAAQVFVAMVNLTGVGIAVTSQIIGVAGGNIWAIASIMAVVCLIAGMGLPTSAAYVLVAAVFAPVLIQQGLDPVMVHLFVLYYAALSVITPPVCVAVFVSSTIAQAPWVSVARDTLRLGGVGYALPMLFIAYPGLLLQGGPEAIAHAAFSGIVFVVSVAALSANQQVPLLRHASALIWIAIAVFALLPGWPASLFAAALLIAALKLPERLSATT